MRTILDPRFEYVPSFETDLRQTFARIRDRHRQANGPRPEVIYLPDRMTHGSGVLQSPKPLSN